MQFNQSNGATMLIHLHYRMWSVDGIETIIMGENKIMCVTNHLTSFAVLIDHQGIISVR